MRAIPSPTSNTVPTSSQDTDASKFANCFLRIAETSAAFICAIIFMYEYILYFVFIYKSPLFGTSINFRAKIQKKFKSTST